MNLKYKVLIALSLLLSLNSTYAIEPNATVYVSDPCNANECIPVYGHKLEFKSPADATINWGDYSADTADWGTYSASRDNAGVGQSTAYQRYGACVTMAARKNIECQQTVALLSTGMGLVCIAVGVAFTAPVGMACGTVTAGATSLDLLTCASNKLNDESFCQGMISYNP